MSLPQEILDTNLQEKGSFTEFSFPLNFKFRIGTLANDFTATDSNNVEIAYVRQKMFKFKEAITVYSNTSKSNELYKINADRIIDLNANYTFTDADNETLGRVGRKGMKSLWRSNYTVMDKTGAMAFGIKEENPWAKVMDGLFSEIPLLGIFTGYFFNPKYLVSDLDGNPVVRLSKIGSFWGRKFKLDKLGDLPKESGESVMLSLMMMVLLERRRG